MPTRVLQNALFYDFYGFNGFECELSLTITLFGIYRQLGLIRTDVNP